MSLQGSIGGANMKRNAKRLLVGAGLILGILLAVLILTDIRSTGKAFGQLEDIKIGYRAQVHYLPAYVAYKNGYFVEEGLNAELVGFESTNNIVEAIINGNLDASLGGINNNVLWTIEQKTPGLMDCFGIGYTSEDFDAIIVKQDSTMTLKGLEGKKISVFPGTTGRKWLELMEDKEKIKFEIVEMSASQQLNALASSSVDAAYVLEPLVTIAKEKGIGKILVKSPQTNYYLENHPLTTSILSKKIDAKRARKIINVYDKAVDFINSHPKEAKDLYQEFLKLDKKTSDQLPLMRYSRSDEVDFDALQAAADRALETGMIQSKIDVRKMFHD